MFQPDKLSDLLKPSPVEAAPAPFTLESLIAWLRTKDAADIYCYRANGDCLIAKYLKEVCGWSDPCVGGFDLNDGDGDNMEIPIHWNDIAVEAPHTFGAALSRALAYQAGAK